MNIHANLLLQLTVAVVGALGILTIGILLLQSLRAILMGVAGLILVSWCLVLGSGYKEPILHSVERQIQNMNQQNASPAPPINNNVPPPRTPDQQAPVRYERLDDFDAH